MKMNGNGGGNGGCNGGPTQTIRIEQAPLKIIAVDPNSKEKKTYEI